ncbi:MAG TPA: L,D-transpeptidase [Gaiellaceae bacterium]|nr:L,D-transpeptidase [Gaiellaceae bacterium]
MKPTAALVRLGGGLFGDRRRLGSLAAAAAAAGVLASGAQAAPKAASQSIVAQAIRPAVAVYRKPGARRPFTTLRNPNAHGSQLVFLVKSRRPGWEHVYLPMRPDGATGWIRDSQVQLAIDPYRIVVSLGRHRITVYKGRRIFYAAPAGVGRSVTSTPTGTYYLVELLEQTDPSGPYGPYAFGLSAFSKVLYSFGGGPGEIGLHGTDEPSGLGTDVSHGCIRISNAGITKLAHTLPLGTPITIMH